jgi:hypothetical protein
MVTEQEHILDFSMELFSNESHHYLDKNALFYFNLKKDECDQLGQSDIVNLILVPINLK